MASGIFGPGYVYIGPIIVEQEQQGQERAEYEKSS